MVLAQFVFLIFGIFAIPLLAKITKIPNALLVPVILALCFVGAFAVRNNIGDVVVALVFGGIGYVLFKNKWPLQCLVLGLVLGDIAESNFNRALQISSGSYKIFIEKPISLILLIGVFLVLAWTFFGNSLKKAFKRG